MEFIVAVCLLGLITGAIAKNKGHSFGKWWFYGAALFIVALPMVIMLKPLPGTPAAVADPSNLRKCPKCAEWIQNEASICRFCNSEVTPLPPPKPAKNHNHVPGWLVILVFIIVGAFIYGKAHESGSGNGAVPNNSPSSLPTNPSNSPISNETFSQQNAVKSAKHYLSFAAFSHDGLVQQLEYEKYSHTDAVYGADNSDANWNEQASKSAKHYLSFTAFSHDGLVQQLMHEKFTQEQAEYGAKAVGL